MSPVHVEDVARAFERSLEMPDTVGGCYPLCGPEALPWPEIIRRIAEASGKRKLILPAPVGPIRLVAAIFDRFEFFPVTRDQLTMLVQGNTGDSRAIFGLLGIEPRRFDLKKSRVSRLRRRLCRRPAIPRTAVVSRPHRPR